MLQSLRDLVRPYLYDKPHLWGGESYIQLVTGINFAFFALKELSYRKTHLADAAKEIRDSTLMTIEDKSMRSGIMSIMVGHCGTLGKAHDFLWRICRLLALVFGLVGLGILYTGGTGRITWILVLPIALYISSAYIAIRLFWLVCKGFTWICNKKRPDIPDAVAEAKGILNDPIKKD